MIPDSTPPGQQGQHDTGSDADLQKQDQEFEALLDNYAPGAPESSRRDEIIEVRVVSLTDDAVLVDVGGKAEGSISLSEFPQVDGKPAVEVGQTIRVVQRGGRSDDGPRLSYRDARARDAEASIREAHEKELPVRGRVTDIVKGGVMVDIGLGAFMPASQVDLLKVPDLETLRGQELEAYVIEFDPRRKRAVLSRRKLLFQQREAEKQRLLGSLNVGDTITGKVKSALDFGVFVDLGIVDGFIPREEVSWDRGTHPNQVVKQGTDIEVKVVKVDGENGKITLSRKRMMPDPWETIDQEYQPGSTVKGSVIAIQNYGVFIHLKEGVTGMIHASDLSWSPGNKKPGEFVSMGQEVEAKVLEVNKAEKRLSLGLKQLGEDPWEKIAQEYTKGSRVKGTVTSLTNYGAFVRLSDFIEGMVHVSDLSWERRINHPKEVLKVGQEVEALVLKVEPEQHRIGLGIKQLAESPIDAFLHSHPVGSVVTGKVTRFAPYGAFVELGPSLEGLIHISQIDEKRVELPESVLQVGEEVTCKIVKVDERQQKISLSRKEALRTAERENIRQYMRKSSEQAGGMNVFGDALNRARGEGGEGGEE